MELGTEPMIFSLNSHMIILHFRKIITAIIQKMKQKGRDKLESLVIIEAGLSGCLN